MTVLYANNDAPATSFPRKIHDAQVRVFGKPKSLVGQVSNVSCPEHQGCGIHRTVRRWELKDPLQTIAPDQGAEVLALPVPHFLISSSSLPPQNNCDVR